MNEELSLEMLYSFESDTYIICEFKRLDVSSEESPDKRFFWFKYKKDSHEACKLHFVSMSQSHEGHERSFEEGKFHFNEKEALFRSKNEDLYLVTQDVAFSGEFKRAIENYF